MYRLQIFLQKNHNMGHNVTTRNAISFSQKFLKLKNTDWVVQSASNTCATAIIYLVCFYKNQTTWSIYNQT